LGGESIGLCDKIVSMNMCLILNGYRDGVHCNHKYKKKTLD